LTIKQIILGLESKSDKEIAKSLLALKSEGNHKVIQPLAKLLLTVNDPKIEKEVLELFSSLKISSAVPEMMEILKNDDFGSIRQKLLATIWNTQLDYSFFMADFVSIACDGDYLEALDCLTILENMPGPFEERHLLEAQWHLKELMEDDAPKDERKMNILSDIALFVKDADLEIEGF